MRGYLCKAARGTKELGQQTVLEESEMMKRACAIFTSLGHQEVGNNAVLRQLLLTEHSSYC